MRAIVAGTTHPNADGSDRGSLIRKYCRDGASVFLMREPMNPYGSNAIAVYLEVPFLVFWRRRVQIGYVKSAAAKHLAPKMDRGCNVRAFVVSFFAPTPGEWPRVSIDIIVSEST